MIKLGAVAAMFLIAGAAGARQPVMVSGPARQSPTSPAMACPRGTFYAMIRHNVVKPGKWAVFEKAVADHSRWYVGKGSKTTTRIVRVVEARRGAPAMSNADVVTITRYVGTQPERDAGYTAFTAGYKESATIRDEMRVCMPAL